MEKEIGLLITNVNEKESINEIINENTNINISNPYQNLKPLNNIVQVKNTNKTPKKKKRK
jgi:hypothetical protein